MHNLTYTQHTTDPHPRNHIVRCTCGWASSGTWKAVHERGPIHLIVFRHETRAWNDPDRTQAMPMAAYT